MSWDWPWEFYGILGIARCIAKHRKPGRIRGWKAKLDASPPGMFPPWEHVALGSLKLKAHNWQSDWDWLIHLSNLSLWSWNLVHVFKHLGSSKSDIPKNDGSQSATTPKCIKMIHHAANYTVYKYSTPLIQSREPRQYLYRQLQESSQMQHGGFLKWGYPWIIHFNGNFHHKPSIFGVPPFHGNSQINDFFSPK